jgi:hypothetical protein
MKGPLTIQWKTRSGTGAPNDGKWSKFCKILPVQRNEADEGAAKMIVRVLNEQADQVPKFGHVHLMEFRIKEKLP